MDCSEIGFAKAMDIELPLDFSFFFCQVFVIVTILDSCLYIIEEGFNLIIPKIVATLRFESSKKIRRSICGFGLV